MKDPERIAMLESFTNCSWCKGPCELNNTPECNDKPTVFCRNLRDKYEKEKKDAS